jgi:hypothetical protein
VSTVAGNRVHYKSLAEVPPAIRAAYRAGEYVFRAPPVCTHQWTELDWINYVTFTRSYDGEYTGHKRMA